MIMMKYNVVRSGDLGARKPAGPKHRMILQPSIMS